MKFFRKIKHRKIPSNIHIFFIVIIFACCVFIGIDLLVHTLAKSGFLHGIYIESIRIFFNVLIIGIFITWILKWNQKKQLIQRYRDDIDDFRGWESEEACHRIRGAIVRLNKLQVFDLDLSDCFLEKAYLENVNLYRATLYKANLQRANLFGANLRKAGLGEANCREAQLWYANLQKAGLWRTNLENAGLGQANLQMAYLREANLQEARLADANLQIAYLQEANLKKADLERAKLQKAGLWHADLQNANLRDASLRDAHLHQANLEGANLEGVKGLTYPQLQKAKNWERARNIPEYVFESKDDYEQYVLELGKVLSTSEHGSGKLQ